VLITPGVRARHRAAVLDEGVDEVHLHPGAASQLLADIRTLPPAK